MEEKVRRLEKKLKEANDKAKEAQVKAAMITPTSSTGSTAGEGKRGTTSLEVNKLREEKDQLKDEVTRKESEIGGLKRKADELQAKYDKIFKENESMKKPAALQNRTPRVAKDFTPKPTLVKWVNELEAECGKWR